MQKMMGWLAGWLAPAADSRWPAGWLPLAPEHAHAQRGRGGQSGLPKSSSSVG